jgi:hypothetical protein
MFPSSVVQDYALFPAARHRCLCQALATQIIINRAVLIIVITLGR